ncbi:hypothetical protein QTV49_001749 [Vibrio vulnificus]|nr:hypothetical protein [Vibrio vulnificus]
MSFQYALIQDYSGGREKLVELVGEYVQLMGSDSKFLSHQFFRVHKISLIIDSQKTVAEAICRIYVQKNKALLDSNFSDSDLNQFEIESKTLGGILVDSSSESACTKKSELLRAA